MDWLLPMVILDYKVKEIPLPSGVFIYLKKPAEKNNKQVYKRIALYALNDDIL